MVDRLAAPLGHAHLEHAVGCGGQVRRHRRVLAPVPARLAAAAGLGDQPAVADRGDPIGHGDRDVVERLVLRVVVGGIPAGRTLRLVDDVRAVGREDPALARAVGVDHPLRLALVVDPHDELTPGLDAGGRGDGQLVRPAAAERCVDAVDVEVRDVEPAQVEVEGTEILRRLRGDGRASRPSGCRAARSPCRGSSAGRHSRRCRQTGSTGRRARARRVGTRSHRRVRRGRVPPRRRRGRIGSRWPPSLVVEVGRA